MGIAAERQAEVADVARPVIGLGLAAQHRLHDQRLLGLVGDVLEHAVEQAGRDHLPERQLAVEGGKIVLERDQLLAARRLVQAVDDRRDLAFERLGRGDVGGDHEVLDHAMRVEPLAQAISAMRPCSSSSTRRSGSSSSSGSRLCAGGFERAPAGPQVLEVLLRLALVDPRLRLFIGDHLGDPDDGAGEAPGRDPALARRWSGGRPSPRGPRRPCSEQTSALSTSGSIGTTRSGK